MDDVLNLRRALPSRTLAGRFVDSRRCTLDRRCGVARAHAGPAVFAVGSASGGGGGGGGLRVPRALTSVAAVAAFVLGTGSGRRGLSESRLE